MAKKWKDIPMKKAKPKPKPKKTYSVTVYVNKTVEYHVDGAIDESEAVNAVLEPEEYPHINVTWIDEEEDEDFCTEELYG